MMTIDDINNNNKNITRLDVSLELPDALEDRV